MNGAESLVRTLINSGIEVCFANPGTSELHFVSALDRIGGIKCVLCLFEGVTTAAADGYARMTGKPAATMMHLGPGLANGLANLHNAKRAKVPLLNIVGDHARDHLIHDAPLTSDVEAVARPFSAWVKTANTPEQISSDAAAAVSAALNPPGQVATLILPADIAWSEAQDPVGLVQAPLPGVVDDGRIADIKAVLDRGEPTLFYVTGQAVTEAGLQALSRITQATGTDMLTPINNPRLERGAGRVAIERLFYPVDPAIERLSKYKHIILVETRKPAAFFGYPGKPSELAPKDCEFHTLSAPGEQTIVALEELANRVGGQSIDPATSPYDPGSVPDGPITPDTFGAVLRAVVPENAIICDESLTSGRALFPSTHTANPHTWLQLTGGAIGIGLPLAVGAAVACPDRPVLSLQADGSGMYTLQALWTQARENLNITTVILANRGYQILRGELKNIGIPEPGPIATGMIDVDQPVIDWVSLAQGMGVEAVRTDDTSQLFDLVQAGLKRPGPFLIEARL